jgi:hypothetical protein
MEERAAMHSHCAKRLVQRLGAELRSHVDSIVGRIPTEVTKHCKTRTDGVSSSDLLGAGQRSQGIKNFPDS